ncbi:unnamed protein product [Symbiodinium sp. CCMP2456]|nr:unnamed protein product [Symbiodinium sp. CCMP2456]
MELGCCMAAKASSLTSCGGPCEWDGGSLCRCLGDGAPCEFDITGFCGDVSGSGGSQDWKVASDFLAGTGMDAMVCLFLFFAVTFTLVTAGLLLCFCCSCCPQYGRKSANKPIGAGTIDVKV